MAKGLIYALHGFLGKASDWKPVIAALPEYDFICGEMFGNNDFSEPEMQDCSGKKIFVGYSLGGRLGLGILARSSAKFDHYVFLSTNPGFLPGEELLRAARIQADEVWASKIQASTWDSFVAEWNAQAVFKSDQQEPRRSASEFNLQKLKKSLSENSLGHQPDCRSLIELHQSKITWVVGSRDEKYLELAKSLKINFTEVDAGHRILSDNPQAIIEHIKKI